MIQVQLTPEQLEAKRQQLAQQYGIKLEGNEGTALYRGVKFAYSYDGGTLALKILEKPFMFTTGFCENLARGFFA